MLFWQTKMIKRKKPYSSLFTLLILLLSQNFIQALNYPIHDKAIIEAVDLSGSWQFKFEPNDPQKEYKTGIREKWFDPQLNRSDWKTVTVPGVWDKAPGDITIPVPMKVGWFYRTAPPPQTFKQDITLQFLASMMTTDVWVNGEYLGVHRGGYANFEFDVTGIAHPGEELNIALRVDNRIDMKTVPAPNTGWANFAGLYREVWLLHQPSARPEKIATETKLLQDGSAELSIQGNFVNFQEKNLKTNLKITLHTNWKSKQEQPVVLTTEKIAVETDGETQWQTTLNIKQPDLWSPDNPHLYQLELNWGKNKITMPIGLREIKIDGYKFLLNGKRLWLQGFAWHEEYPGHGPIIPLEIRKREIRKMKNEYQCNYIRPGHYQNHPDFYNLCNETGMIVFSEIPLWWAHEQPNYRIPDDFMWTDESWEKWCRPMLKEMIEQQRNHPSVCFWGISNETHHTHEYYAKATAFVKAMDTSRPVQPIHTSHVDLASFKFSDIGCRNLYYGWYHSRNVYDARRYTPRILRALGNDKPLFITETGCKSRYGDFRGTYGDTQRYRGGELYGDKVVRYLLQYYPTASEQMMGITYWTWSDFHRHKYRPIETLGAHSENFEPKLAAYSARNIFQGDLRAYILESNASVFPDRHWSATLMTFNRHEKKYKNLICQWRIMQGNRELKTGQIKFDINGKRSQIIDKINWRIPATPNQQMYTCWVEIKDENGNWLYTNFSHFDTGSQAANPGVLEINATSEGKKIKAMAEYAGLHIPIYKEPGLLLALPAGTYEIKFTAQDSKPITRTVPLIRGKRTTLTLDFEE